MRFLMKFIDLSIKIANDLKCDPGNGGPRIEYFNHEQGALGMMNFFPKLKKEDLPEGKGWAVETITLGTHHGTHMDSPYHYAPNQDKEIGKKKSLTIDQIPLEWCVGPLVVLDCTDKNDGHVMQPEDLDEKLDAIGHEIQPGDIVCIHTSAPDYFGTSEYVDHGVGVGKHGTLHLVRKGVRIVGTDSWSWDAPFSITALKWKKAHEEGNPDKNIIWEGHFAGIELGYCQIEKMTNLDKVPPLGATIYCFPIKIDRASGGWVRAVASIPE